MQPFVSIIVPIYKEEKFIEQCLLSILAQDYEKGRYEMIFIDGMSPDRTREIVGRYANEYPFIHLLDNPLQVTPYALNKGIKASKGEVIIRLDGHSVYPPNYVSTLVRYLYELNADNVGGIWCTMPAKDTVECHAIAICSSHPFGVGGSIHKIGSHEIKQTDTVPFGCYRREIFDRIGLFDENLVRNQDDEFNARLINHGGKIYIIPELVINYTARDSMDKMRRMYYQYGLFKPLVNKKLGKPATIRQFFPVVFVGSIALGSILGCFSTTILHIFMAMMALYFIIGTTIGVENAIKLHKPALTLYMPYTFLNIHLSYGIGYFTGIYKLMFHKKFEVKANR